MINVYSSVTGFLKNKVRYIPTFYPDVLFLDTYSREMKTCLHK